MPAIYEMRPSAWQNPAMRPLGDLTALVGVTMALLLGPATVAGAETYRVTRTDDPTPGPCLQEDCSLREAAKAANASVGVPDVIIVPASVEHYAIELGRLELGDQVEVQGAGADRVILDAKEDSIAVEAEGKSVVLSGLAITGGQGGIQNNSEELTLRGVSIQDNDRIDGGGGGIQSNGRLTVESSFIGFNTTNSISGSAIQSNGPVTIVNSTLASNESMGPAIQVNAGLTVSSSAIVFNTRLEPGEAAGIRGNPPMTLTDSIVAANRSPDGTVNCEAGEVTSQGGNVEDDATCSPGARDRANTAPGLGMLEPHGGTTQVFNLLPGSAAVDFALNCPPTDQRGAPRPQGSACDSGPFELEPTPAPPAASKDESVTVMIGKGKVHIDRKGFGRVRLTCPQSEQSPPCSGTLRLGHLGKAKVRLGAGKTKLVKFHLSVATVDRLREKPSARRVSAVATVADAAGNHGVAKRRLHLVPPK